MLSSNPHVEGELFPLKQDLLGFLMMQEKEYISCMLVTFFVQVEDHIPVKTLGPLGLGLRIPIGFQGF